VAAGTSDPERGGSSFVVAAATNTSSLLTVSSQIKNPLTSAGRIVDIGLEFWAVFVVTAQAELGWRPNDPELVESLRSGSTGTSEPWPSTLGSQRRRRRPPAQPPEP
jgi:hypothetical protein